MIQTDDNPKQSCKPSYNPQSHCHFTLSPSQSLKVMMDRGGFENLFSIPELLACELNNHGKHFNDEDETNERKDQRLINKNAAMAPTHTAQNAERMKRP